MYFKLVVALILNISISDFRGACGYEGPNPRNRFAKSLETSKGLSSRYECGTRRIKGSSRVEGGEEVIPHSIPWQARLFVNQMMGMDIEWSGHCGGTLISHKHVLTAGHCVLDPMLPSHCSNYLVGLGMQYEKGDGIRKRVSEISYPEDFDYDFDTIIDKRNPVNDFALFTLASPVELSDNIIPACLPTYSMDHDFLVGKTLTVSGWGKGSNGTLHRAQYPGIRSDLCQALLNKNHADSCKHNNIEFTITESHLCAGIPYPSIKSHSGGDSGGPLTYNDNGRETLVGVVSFSKKTCWDSALLNGSVPVYARVTEKLKWIEDEMKKSTGNFCKLNL